MDLFPAPTCCPPATHGPDLVIIGGGHAGCAVAHMATSSGMRSVPGQRVYPMMAREIRYIACCPVGGELVIVVSSRP